jgi:hypothetical protein
VINFTPQLLYFRGKSPRYSLNRRIGGPQSQSGRGDEGKKRIVKLQMSTATCECVQLADTCCRQGMILKLGCYAKSPHHKDASTSKDLKRDLDLRKSK